MDLIPILSTIILISTLITLIVAVASYFVFRLKEKKKKIAKAPVNDAALEEAKKAAMRARKAEGEVIEVTKLLEQKIAGENAEKSVQQTTLSTEEIQTTKKSEVAAERETVTMEYVEEEEELDEEEEEFEDQSMLTPAQAAFMSSMNKVISNTDKVKVYKERTKKMKRFQISPNEDEESKFGSGDDSMWK